MQTSLSGLFASILIPFTPTYPRIDVRIVRDTSTGLLWNRASLRARLVRAFLEQAQYALKRRRHPPASGRHLNTAIAGYTRQSDEELA